MIDFYPTKPATIDKLLVGIKLDTISAFLEPSAGKGHICDYIKRRFPHYGYSRREPDIDVIEIEEEFQHILKGKGYRLVHNDFLTFETQKIYDLIVANFPFSVGAEHLQKALSMLERSGGELSCLVNAETIRNPYTNLRRMIVNTLERFDAEIDFLPDEFIDAERQTSVEVALIKVSVERETGISILLNSFEPAREEMQEEQAETAIVDGDFRKAFVSRFDLEARLGVGLINEWFALKPYIIDRIKRSDEQHDYSKPLIELKIENVWGESRSEYVNSYLRGLRAKYWSLLVHHPQFNASFTSNILTELEDKLKELRNYDFNLFNIAELERELRSKIVTGIEESILKLFDSFSRKYAYDESLGEGNIHYYNGWKTNKAHRVNKKVIIPLHGYSAWSKSMDYRAAAELRDMVKVFNYLSSHKLSNVPQLVGNILHRAEQRGRFTGMDMIYFTVDVYKKGTCHIKFKDENLLEKFNIFGSQRRGWLPPAYGRKPYEEMSQEEKTVIDDFQGKEKYNEVVRESEYYLVDTSQLLLGTSLEEETE